MVSIKAKPANGKAGQAKRKQASVSRARSTIRASQRGMVRTSGYYGAFPQGRTIPGGELKFHDVDVDDAVIAAGSNIQNSGSINLIAQNVTETGRIGRKCTIKQINWRYTIIIPNTSNASNTDDVVRVILYLDKQCNGATAVNTGIMETTSFQSFNNLANKNRFTILMDKVHDLQCPGGGGQGDGTTSSFAFVSALVSGTFFKKCNIPLEFDSTTGAITEIRSNNLGVLLLSAKGLCEFSSKMRLRFSDN